ncbi:hypothetical protein Rcae01_00826 [Novipirellula caenicola]|uniref:Uncharacterized protein n=2 Tax=Novipirellula caenicola TaxID=1536901 RepID=A0ABP9VJJ4_9BACT
MKIQYTVRSTLLATALVAGACGWYSWNVAERRNEFAALDDLERLTKNGVVIADGGHPYDGCGTWSGAMAHLDFRGPSFFRNLNLDAFKRVVRIEVQYEQNPEIIAMLRRFEHLDEVFFNNGSIDPNNVVPPEELGYVSAVRQFRSSHPKIDVRFWDYDEPENILD